MHVPWGEVPGRAALSATRRDADTPFATALTAPEGADSYGQLAAWLGRDSLSRA
ncbi:hypothetical protein ACFY1L_32620 [Streptomyces sp. NPDC001663]|uniref:hypothetical protein n=1 Tax=Streptomyces sp. NPDC001663 TaxID=3364597 RepID=UPI0036BC88E4